MKDTVLKQLHDNSGYFGVRKTIRKIRERFYLSGYESDSEMHVRECGQCQKRNPPQPQSNAPPLRPHTLLKSVLGHYGPLPTSKSGNKYILVVTDLFIKWVEAFPLREISSVSLAIVPKP